MSKERIVDPLEAFGGFTNFANVARIEVQGVMVRITFGDRRPNGQIMNMTQVTLPIDSFQQFTKNAGLIMQVVQDAADREANRDKG